MLDATNSNVLSYVRTPSDGSPAIVVSLNMSATPQTVSLDPSTAGITGKTTRTLLTDVPALSNVHSLHSITLPPFTSWVGSIQ